MSVYRQKRKRSKKEQIGFYTSLSICIIAIGMAAYSTYSSLTGYFEADTTQIAPVNQVVTGVTETESTTETTEETTEEITDPTPAEIIVSTETVADVESTDPTESLTALQTMLTVNTSLSYPLDNAHVLREYSEETVYNKTLNQWQAHTGVDFKCSVGDNVYSMGDGEVVRVYEDDMLGNTVVVKSATYTAYYSGLSDKISLQKGSAVKTGDIIGLAAVVPCEAMDATHVHIEIKVDGNYVDPLNLINSNE